MSLFSSSQSFVAAAAALVSHLVCTQLSRILGVGLRS